MSISKKSLETQIYEDWGSNPESEICIALLNYLLRIPMDRSCHITFGSLKIAINNEHTDVELLKAVQYLCGDRTKLLEVNFELIENEENIFSLSKSDVAAARKTGMLIHPETGEIIEDFEEKVFMYFEPSYLVKNIN
ncbi:hypothetical protein CAL7716_101670 (plasmid) [Calothrix sp. PCC 7716]|nr:hypothetical protein CAL7716_101670 [Calothrix sp. PCC 7716]